MDGIKINNKNNSLESIRKMWMVLNQVSWVTVHTASLKNGWYSTQSVWHGLGVPLARVNGRGSWQNGDDLKTKECITYDG
ncbi:MAG: hypothetical protein JXQ97_08435 [Natronospirillum sp.]